MVLSMTQLRTAVLVGVGSYLLYRYYSAQPHQQKEKKNTNGLRLKESLPWLARELPKAFPSASFTAPLSPTPFGGVGCRLHNIDLTANGGALTPSQAAFIVEVLSRFRVLSIAEQDVSPNPGALTLQGFEQFASHFGALVPHPNNLLRGGEQAQGKSSSDARVTALPYERRPAAKVDAWFGKGSGISCLPHASPAVLTVANIGPAHSEHAGLEPGTSTPSP